MRKIRIGLWFLSAVFILTACTPASSPTISTVSAGVGTQISGESEPTIEIKLFSFPELVEVPVGSTVTWLNQDGTQHSVTSGTPEQDGQAELLDGVFDSGFFVQGESFSFTFTEPGDYPYFCMRHNHMQGIIRVVP